MKLYYITNVRFPTEKAHGWQIAKMCEAFLDCGADLILVIPTRKTPITASPETYYALSRPIPTVQLPVWDAFAVAWMPRILAFWIVELQFQRAVRRWMRTQTDSKAWVMTRDQFLVSALRRPGWRTAFEAHDVPPSFYRRHRRLTRFVDLFIATNAWKRDEMLRQWGKDLASRIIVAPNAIDLEPYHALPTREDARTLLGWDPHAKYVFYTGHLYTWKGVYTLAEASRLLPEDVQVVYVGGTLEDIAAMRRHVAEQSLTRIKIVGHVPHTDVLTYLGAADVLVLPNSGKDWNSRYTTSPIKLWEYLAARRPVVASDLPSIRELVSDREVRFAAPDDPTALAQSITAALAGDEARVKAGWQLAVHSTWKSRAEHILERFVV